MQEDSPQSERSDYLDFELEIDRGQGHEYPVTVLRSPAGEARETMHFPFDDLALDLHLSRLQIALLRSGGRYRRVPSQEEQAVQDLGQALFDALFSGEIRSHYDISLYEAEQQDQGLRLKLRIRPPELNALPWEFMYDPRQAEYVCLSRQTPIVRYLESPRLIRPLIVTPPLRILGMIASPKDQPSLDIEREKLRVERAIEGLEARALVKLEWLSGQTWRDLQEAMWGGPWHVFHFIGHGGFDANTDEGFIALADSAGRTNLMSATRLGRLLADHSALRLVLLNSCEGAKGSDRDIFSSTASILVRRGISAVLAMQYEVTDQAAIEFARAFYRALAYGMSVDEAVVAARKAISLAVNNTVEWGTPVLYMRTPDGVLFQMTEPPPPLPEDSKPPSDVEPELKQPQEQVARLYEEAQGLAHATRWRQTLAKMEEIYALDSQFADPEGINKKALAEVARDRESRQRFDTKVLSELISSKWQLRKILIAIGAFALIAILVAVGVAIGPALIRTLEPSDAPVPGPTPIDLASGAVWEWSDDSTMVYVPAGTFWMGSDADDSDAANDEKPQHEVYLDAFWVDRTEVTNAQYRRCVEAEECSQPSNPRSYTRDSYYGNKDFDDYPVIYVSWEQAKTYCTWASKRLPTEAEWEKAARGSDKSIYPWGNKWDVRAMNRCNFSDKNNPIRPSDGLADDGYADTAPASSYPDGASPCGALDMAGNVWEWVADWYAEDYYATSPGRNPLGPNSGERHVLRGGSWNDDLGGVRTVDRSGDTPSSSDNLRGFRCAHSVSEPSLSMETPAPTNTPPSPTDTVLPMPSPTKQASWRQGKIAFISKQTGRNRLYVGDLSSAEIPIEEMSTQLPKLAGAEDISGPWWSPDGAWLAFYARVEGSFQVMTIAGAGDGTPWIVGTGSQADFTSSPTWAPDGRRIVCYGEKGRTYFFILNAFSGHFEAQLDPRVAIARLPAWAPTDDLIAFSSDEDGNWDIYTFSLAGGAPTNLTQNSAQNYAPAWSPNGKRIAYQSDLNRGGSHNEIWIMERTGRNPRQVTYSPSDTWSRAPTWSPDGQWIAFVSDQAGSIGADYGELFVVSVETRDVAQLTYTGGQVYDWRPSWGP